MDYSFLQDLQASFPALKEINLQKADEDPVDVIWTSMYDRKERAISHLPESERKDALDKSRKEIAQTCLQFLQALLVFPEKKLTAKQKEALDILRDKTYSYLHRKIATKTATVRLDPLEYSSIFERYHFKKQSRPEKYEEKEPTGVKRKLEKEETKQVFKKHREETSRGVKRKLVEKEKVEKGEPLRKKAKEEIDFTRVMQTSPKYQLIQERYNEAIQQGATPKELDLIIAWNLPQLHKEANIEKAALIQERIIKAIDGLVKTHALAQEVGNKTANLQRLSDIFQGEEGVLVPPFKGIPHRLVLAYVRENFPHYDTLWESFKNHIKAGGTIESGKEILAEIRKGLRQVLADSIDFPDESYLDAFIEAGKSMMVRSTGREDTLELANPGGNESVSNVLPERTDVAKANSTVVGSYFSEKSLFQRKASFDDITIDPFMPILLQEMVRETSPDNIPISGVMYTTEPELNTRGVVQISSTFGHAEGVVTGFSPTDTYYVQDNFVHGIVHEKPTRKVPKEEGGLQTTANPHEKRNVSSLSYGQLLRLQDIARRIEESYGYPMDVEWSFDPQSDTFYIFQARPIVQKEKPQPTHLIQEKIQQLQDVQQVTVIVSGGGQVCLLTKENTIVADSAPEALEIYRKNPEKPPKAILIRKPTAINSHEAGFFRERNIPLIQFSSENYQSAVKTLQNDVLLIDTQEAIAARLPRGQKAEDFIAEGLRRHLAPKMESSVVADLHREDFDDFEKMLVELAKEIDHEELDLEHLKTFGFNALDRLLNAFEIATLPQERAYVLYTLIHVIESKLLLAIPEEQRQALLCKILYNAQHAWKIYSDPESDELHKKFAMNWLRAAILQRPAEGVVNADTLYVALGEVKERKDLHISYPGLIEKEQAGYLDIFHRSSKFILSGKDRKNWMKFVDHLDAEQLQNLASFFAVLGPSTVEVWLNSEFGKIWQTTHGVTERSAECLKILMHQAQDKNIIEALQIAAQSKEIARIFTDISGEFADPVRFEQLMQRLENELLLTAGKCINAMQKAEKFDATILSHAFVQLFTAYDSCIKGLTSSPFYADNATIKAQRFAEMLNGYYAITMRMFKEKILWQDPVLLKQAEDLGPFIRNKFAELKDKIKVNPQQLLLPTSSFAVAIIALGSGYMTPERSSPESLEDLFTLLHQSLYAAAASVERRAGIKVDKLPTEVQSLCTQVCQDIELRLGRGNPTIQRIEYHYPNIKISFNCPLRNHSAQFVIEAQVNSEGKLVSCNFEARFFTPPGIRSGRTELLLIYALDTYYPSYSRKAMIAPFPEGIQPYKGEMIAFKWQFFPLELDPNEYWKTAKKHLQLMIDNLQTDGAVGLPFIVTGRMINDHPWIFPHFTETSEWTKLDKFRKKQLANAFTKAVVNNLTDEHIEYILKYSTRIIRADRTDDTLQVIVDKLIDLEIVWKPPLLEEMTELLREINPNCNKLYANQLKPFTKERLKKIETKIQEIHATLSIEDYEVREFLKLYSPEILKNKYKQAGLVKVQNLLNNFNEKNIIEFVGYIKEIIMSDPTNELFQMLMDKLIDTGMKLESNCFFAMINLFVYMNPDHYKREGETYPDEETRNKLLQMRPISPQKIEKIKAKTNELPLKDYAILFRLNNFTELYFPDKTEIINIFLVRFLNDFTDENLEVFLDNFPSAPDLDPTNEHFQIILDKLLTEDAIWNRTFIPKLFKFLEGINPRENPLDRERVEKIKARILKIHPEDYPITGHMHLHSCLELYFPDTFKRDFKFLFSE